MFTGHRAVRGRRLPPLSGWSLPPRRRTPARSVKVTRHQQEFPGSRPIGHFPSPVATMAGAAALGLCRELRTRPVRNRPRTSRRGQAEHKPVATSLASARPPRLAHSPCATSCRNCRPSPCDRPPRPRSTTAAPSRPRLRQAPRLSGRICQVTRPARLLSEDGCLGQRSCRALSMAHRSACRPRVPSPARRSYSGIGRGTPGSM